ncbi:MAG: hypothetical protein L3J57_14085 [Desulfuromusa sp.]|nr:hypothetical protein [Desulfuromusa sp.]
MGLASGVKRTDGGADEKAASAALCSILTTRRSYHHASWLSQVFAVRTTAVLRGS